MIVITTPTGQIGSAVLADLVDGHEPVRVVARDASRLEPAVRGRVEVVEGSHRDPAVLGRALRGAGALLFIVPPDPTSEDVDETYRAYGQAAAAAVADAGVPRVVVVSSLGREDEPAGLLSASIDMDRLVRGTGTGVRVLRMPFYMENLIGQAGRIAEQGVFSLTNAADRTLLLVATSDVAAEAARLLRDDTWGGQADVAVASPDDLTPEGMAQVMSEALGRPVRFEQAERDDFVTMMTGRVSGAWARAMVEMSAAQDRGFYDGTPREPAILAPTTFRTWCAEILAPALAS